MRLLSCILISFISLQTITAQADEEQQKIDFIEQQFSNTRDHSKTWQWGWFGFLGSATVAQAIGANTLDHDTMKYDMGVGAATSFLGAVDMLINPMVSHYYSDELQSMDKDSGIINEAKLRQAELWLYAAAEREVYEQSFMNHLLAGFVNGLGALVIAYDDDRPGDALLSFAAGMAVSEFKIYTAPQTMMAAKEAYQRGNYQLNTVKVEEQRLFVAASGPNLFVNWKF
jgi:hypothetical protein